MSTLQETANCSNERCSGTTNCQDTEVKDVVGCAMVSGRPEYDEYERQAIRMAITSYDFAKVRYRLESEEIIPLELIDTAIEEFRKYLTVILHSNGPVGMISPIVDEVWHAFILHTVDYRRFCRDVMGFFLHHEPNTPWSPAGENSVPNFTDGYNELYGELDPIWTEHIADAYCELCGKCNCHPAPPKESSVTQSNESHHSRCACDYAKCDFAGCATCEPKCR